MNYVYKVTNKLNGKFYIGKRKHKDPHHDKYMGSGSRIKAAIKKYGIENFDKEILAIFDTNDEAAKFEASLVTKDLVESGNTYNMHEGGHGGFAHINSAPPDQRANVIAWREKYARGEFKTGGDTSAYFTEDSYARMKVGSAKGNEVLRNRSIEEKQATRDKLSKATSGCGNSQYGTKVCVNLETGEKKRFKEIPAGWITTAEWRDSKKDKTNSAYGRHWYNDGEKNYYLKPDDVMIAELNLEKRRLSK